MNKQKYIESIFCYLYPHEERRLKEVCGITTNVVKDIGGHAMWIRVRETGAYEFTNLTSEPRFFDMLKLYKPLALRTNNIINSNVDKISAYSIKYYGIIDSRKISELVKLIQTFNTKHILAREFNNIANNNYKFDELTSFNVTQYELNIALIASKLPVELRNTFINTMSNNANHLHFIKTRFKEIKEVGTLIRHDIDKSNKGLFSTKEHIKTSESVIYRIKEAEKLANHAGSQAHYRLAGLEDTTKQLVKFANTFSLD